MKPIEIQVGKTYVNKGAGMTRRKVLDIGEHVQPPPWVERTGERIVCVEYEDQNRRATLPIKSFASWAGKEAK